MKSCTSEGFSLGPLPGGAFDHGWDHTLIDGLGALFSGPHLPGKPEATGPLERVPLKKAL